ncbi:MAG TPA: Uma2 family endonuclease [Thermoanaerobaculia bacterium]|nr:Uma2 family endonuclease [Thermoanaerobaculia bacterium]
MSQQAAAALAPLPFELVYDDGEPLETEWHTLEYPLLRRLIRQAMAEQGRADFYAGGNMFVYYSVEQARDVSEEMTKGLPWRAFRGPDVFWVGGVDPHRERKVWISWEEGGRLPDVIVELLSPSTAKKDRTEKRDLYARVFRTAEYFLCDPDKGTLEGLRLAGRFYQSILPDENGRLWSEQLGVFLGTWHGAVDGREGDWVRLFRPDGNLVPMPEEQAEAERQVAEAEHQRADAESQRADLESKRANAESRRAEEEHWRAEAERQRAEGAETELARLRALLAER